MKAPAFDYVRADSLDQVFDLLGAHGGDANLLAGGQSLLAALNMRLSAPALLVDINGLKGLAGITISDEAVVRIGALTRHVEVEHSSEIAAHLPLIHQAMPFVAHPAIRNRGTFGGSIAFADPAAELPACSVALKGRFVLAGPEGERTVPAVDFFHGLYETELQPDEVLVAAEFPRAPPGYRSAFAELARRHGDYAVVGLAAHGRVDAARLSDLRLVFFSVDVKPVEARHAAMALEGAVDLTEAIRQAQEALKHDLDPLDDPMMPGAAKLHLARVLLGRAARALVGHAA